jgi:hypothetical protein
MPIIDTVLDKAEISQIGDIALFNKQNENEELFIYEIIPLIEDQIYNLNNLGINYLSQYKLRLIDTSKQDLVNNILIYTHENYINIMQIESIMQDQFIKFVFANYIYDLYSTQLITKILPLLISINEFKSSLEIISKLNSNTIKNKILNVLYKLCDIIGKLNKDVMIQYTYYIDLFDNNLENFFENFLIPIIIKYEMEINSYVK